MSVYYLKKEQKDIIGIVVNYELIEVAPDLMAPKLVYLFFKPEREIDDFEAFFYADQEIQKIIQTQGSDYFAGARLSDGWVELYYYTNDSKALRHALQEKLSVGVQYEIGSKNDDAWKFFFDKLQPSSFEKREINNRFVIEELLDAGDNLSLEHLYEHRFYSHTASQREKIKNDLLALGHYVKEELQDEAMEQRFVLVTEHKADANLATINSFSKEATDIAFKYHALYEGWTTDLALS